jgi:hypothetical protein
MGKKKGNREVHVLWSMGKEEKSFLFAAQDSDEVALRANLSTLCSGWIKRVRRLPGLDQGGCFVQDLIDLEGWKVKLLGLQSGSFRSDCGCT